MKQQLSHFGGAKVDRAGSPVKDHNFTLISPTKRKVGESQ